MDTQLSVELTPMAKGFPEKAAGLLLSSGPRKQFKAMGPSNIGPRPKERKVC